MGNGNSSGPGAGGSSKGMSGDAICTGRDAPGINTHCYMSGYDGAKNAGTNPTGDGINAGICSYASPNAKMCYDKGVRDATSGVSAGDSAGRSSGVGRTSYVRGSSTGAIMVRTTIKNPYFGMGFPDQSENIYMYTDQAGNRLEADGRPYDDGRYFDN